MTVQIQITDISNQLRDQLIQKARAFRFCALAIDGSTYIRDTAQLLIFIRAVDPNFNITEKLVGLCSMSDGTTRKDIEVTKCNLSEHFSYMSLLLGENTNTEACETI